MIQGYSWWIEKKENCMKALATTAVGRRAGGDARLRRAARCSARTATPPRGNIEAAVALQNGEVYDLAASAWGKFIEANPSDSRVDPARHYQGVCYFRTAVSALEAKQNDAAAKAFDAAEQAFDAVVKAAPRFDLLEETYLFRGLAQFKRAEIGTGRSRRPNATQSAAAALRRLC